jgi:ribonuclease HI
MADSDGSLYCSPIELHADGSFSQERGVGAWAYLVPTLNLEGVGSADGKTATRFEFLAVLCGLEAVAAVDNTGLPIQVFSDCQSTVAAIDRLRAGLPLIKPGKYADRADLLPRLQAVLEGREVQVTWYGGGRMEHKACHRKAIRKLREEINSDPQVRHRAVLTRHRSRLGQLIGERGKTLDRLEKLDREISCLQLEIEALELAMPGIAVESCAALIDGPGRQPTAA